MKAVKLLYVFMAILALTSTVYAQEEETTTEDEAAGADTYTTEELEANAMLYVQYIEWWETEG